MRCEQSVLVWLWCGEALCEAMLMLAGCVSASINQRGEPNPHLPPPQVLSADAFSAFEEVGLDHDEKVVLTGQRFRDTVSLAASWL